MLLAGLGLIAAARR
ncbi:MAG: hypothetical protein Q8M64_16525 [Methyloversatilis sp.]|nr:hypothetical protein [Methyloversatilis sp.]